VFDFELSDGPYTALQNLTFRSQS